MHQWFQNVLLSPNSRFIYSTTNLLFPVRCLICISNWKAPNLSWWSPFKTCSSYHLSYLSNWQLHLSSCSGPKPWDHPWLVSVLHTPYLNGQRIQLATTSKQIQNPATSLHVPWSKPLSSYQSSLAWIIAMAYLLLPIFSIIARVIWLTFQFILLFHSLWIKDHVF